MRKLTRSEARELAEEPTEDLSAYIAPSDVVDGCETWDEVPDKALKHELYKTADIVVKEEHEPYHDVIRDLALSIWLDLMPRVRMEDLAIDDERETLLEHEYWPTDMSKGRALEILDVVDDIQVPPDVWVEAVSVVKAGIRDGMDPR